MAAGRGRARTTPREGPGLCVASDGLRRRPLGFSDPGRLGAGKASLLLRTQCLWVWAKSQSCVSSRFRPRAWGRPWRLRSPLASPRWWGWVLRRGRQGLGGFPGSAGGRLAAQSLAFSGLFRGVFLISPAGISLEDPWIHGIPWRHVREAGVGVFQVRPLSGEKAWPKFGGTGGAFSWEVKPPNVDSQDLLEEGAETHSPSPAGTRARDENTMCPPHHTCFYELSVGIFSQQCCSRWKRLETWQVCCVGNRPFLECSILFLQQNLLQLSSLLFFGRNLINNILKTSSLPYPLFSWDLACFLISHELVNIWNTFKLIAVLLKADSRRPSQTAHGQRTYQGHFSVWVRLYQTNILNQF